MSTAPSSTNTTTNTAPNTTTVNIHQAKTQLSRLLEQVAAGQDVIIAKAGKPVARLVALAPPSAQRQLGGLAGRGVIPGDIKTGFDDDIDAMFYKGR